MSILNSNRSSRSAAMLATQAGQALPPPSLAQSTFSSGVSPSDIAPGDGIYIYSPNRKLTEKDIPEIFKRARATSNEGQRVFDTVVGQLVEGVAQFSNGVKIDLINHGIDERLLKQEHLRWFEGEVASWIDQAIGGRNPILAKDLPRLFRIISSCQGFSSVQERITEILPRYIRGMGPSDQISLFWHIGARDSETAKLYAKEVIPAIQRIVNDPKCDVEALTRHQAGQLSALLLVARIDLADSGRNSCILKSKNEPFLRALSHISSGQFDGLSIEVDPVRYGVNPTFSCRFEGKRAFIFIEQDRPARKNAPEGFVQIRDLDRSMEDQILKDRDVQVVRMPLSALLGSEDVVETFKNLIRHGSDAQERTEAEERVVVFE